jgi:NTE family protein
MRAFVLSGGGSLGAAQAGAVLALLERGIEPDLLVGTSAGAINAAYLAGRPGLPRVGHLASFWTSINSREVFPTRPWHLHGPSLLGTSGLRKLLERNLGYTRIEDAKIPVRIVATELPSMRGVAFSYGPVVDAVLASAALPGVLPPVRVGGRYYVDGGFSDNVPISTAVEMGATEIYLIQVGPGASKGTIRGVDFVWRNVGRLLNRRLSGDVRRYSDRVKIVRLPTAVSGPTGLWKLSDSVRLVRESRTVVGEYLDRAKDEGLAS